jgi:hypothetical protein
MSRIALRQDHEYARQPVPVLRFAVLSFDRLALRALVPFDPRGVALLRIAFVAGCREIVFAVESTSRMSFDMIDHGTELIEQWCAIVGPVRMVIRERRTVACVSYLTR